jgi:hypothetical protein
MVATPDYERLHPVMRVTTVPRNRLRPGTVVMARVLYGPQRDRRGATSSEREKIRPVVVVGVRRDGIICRPCTSAASRHRRPWAHTELADLESAGLTRATGVRLREVVIPFTDCFTVCGVLAASDLERVFGTLPAVRSKGGIVHRRMSVVADTVFP